jgi:hypothetical protein
MRAYLFAVGLCVTGCVVEEVDSVEQHVMQQRVLLPVSGTGQHKIVTNQFHPLDVALSELDGTPVVGATITFTVPQNGASATFADGGATETDGEGRATLCPFANQRAGAYTVWAHADGADPMPFLLTNHPAAPTRVTVGAGANQGAAFGQPFASPLAVDVSDAYGNPVQGVPVAFIPPVHGPTARMVDRAVTDAAGRATTFPVAGDQPGSYAVDALVDGVGEYRFTLTNHDPTESRWTYEVSAKGALHEFTTSLIH